MNVVSRKTLVEFWTRHPRARAPLAAWFEIARAAREKFGGDTAQELRANYENYLRLARSLPLDPPTMH